MNMNKEVMLLNLKDILPNRFQPRIVFKENEIAELAESIKEHGVIQPIVVRKIADKYEIIAGERRYKASLEAGKTTIPAIITDLNDKDSAEIALIENIQRSNLTPIEEAISYKKILDMGYLSQSDLALKLGKTQSTVANKLRLLNLSEDVQEELLKGRISERHARSLLRLEKEDQEKMVKRIINERLTVRKTDEEIEKLLHPKEDSKQKEPEKKVVKYVLDDEDEEGGNKNMENKEVMGSFNIPTTPILEKTEETNMNNQGIFGNTGMANNNVAQPSTVSPVEIVDPMVSSQNSIPNNPFNISSQPQQEEPAMPVGNPFITNNIEPSTSAPESASVGENLFTPNPEEASNNFNSNSSNNIANVDPTNPEPVTGGKFFNMFSETETSGDEGTTPNIVSNTQNETEPIQQMNSVAPSVGTGNIFSSPMDNQNSTPVAPVTSEPAPILEQNNVAPQGEVQTPTPVETPQPFPSDNLFNQFTPTQMEEPVQQGSPVVSTNEPISIDTVPAQPQQEEPAPMPNMTPLQTYRLNDDQTFENSSVVELGTFGGGRMEEAVLQPLRVEETKKPRASMKEVINTIRDCAKAIENLGYTIDTDEIDYEDNYQVTFKIIKEDV